METYITTGSSTTLEGYRLVDFPSGGKEVVPDTLLVQANIQEFEGEQIWIVCNRPGFDPSGTLCDIGKHGLVCDMTFPQDDGKQYRTGFIVCWNCDGIGHDPKGFELPHA